MKLKKEADAGCKTACSAVNRVKSFTVAAAAGLAALVASPESILNTGSPIPSAFTMG